MSDLVPKYWLIGIRGREDKLAFFTFYQGVKVKKINSQTSFDGWRDSSLEPIEFINDFIEGWRFEDTYHARYGQSNRKLFVITDPRHGYQFELDVKDVVPMLHNMHVVDGVLQGKWALNKYRGLISEQQYNEIKEETSDHIKLTKKIIKIGDIVKIGTQRDDAYEYIYIGDITTYSFDKKRLLSTIYLKKEKQICFVNVSNYNNRQITSIISYKGMPSTVIKIGKHAVPESDIITDTSNYISERRNYIGASIYNSYENKSLDKIRMNHSIIEDQRYGNYYSPFLANNSGLYMSVSTEDNNVVSRRHNNTQSMLRPVKFNKDNIMEIDLDRTIIEYIRVITNNNTAWNSDRHEFILPNDMFHVNITLT